MISGVNSKTYTGQINNTSDKNAKPQSLNENNSDNAGVILDIGKSESKSAVYGKPSAKIDSKEIDRLWDETNKATESLRNLVERLIARQGKKVDDVVSGKDVLVVDSKARAEAQKAISENGEWGVKAVSSRIVDFAKAISGGDKSRLEELKSAIDEGFKQAEKAFGGSLPEICQNTYDEVMKQLDAWQKEE